MPRLSRPILRTVQATLLALVVIFTMGAADPGSRFTKLGHEMICTCSCNQILNECNHVGCPISPVMLSEVQAGIDKGDSDDLILQSFVQKYGPTVLAAPSTQGFNRVAWIMPFAVLLLGILGTLMLVRKWKLRTVDMPDIPNTPSFDRLRDRIREDTDEFQGDPRP